MPAISKLRHRVVVEFPKRSPDGQGGTTVAWVEKAQIWAEVKPKKSLERIFAEQIQLQRTHVITCRFLDGVTNEMRITWDDRIFQIKGVRVTDEKGFWLEIDVEENQAT